MLRAKARLDRLAWWPRPVRIDHIHVFVTPWFFRLPWFRRFDGHAFHVGMLLRSGAASDDLIAHELCHVWQMQHRPVRMPLSYLVRGYWNNPYERQARAAAAHGTVPAGDCPPGPLPAAQTGDSPLQGQSPRGAAS